MNLSKRLVAVAGSGSGLNLVPNEVSRLALPMPPSATNARGRFFMELCKCEIKPTGEDSCVVCGGNRFEDIKSFYEGEKDYRWKQLIKINPENGCWEWIGARNKDYGLFRFGDGKTQSAHRLMWRFFKGKIPKGMNIHHKCYNPPCCNPDHLEAVTVHENQVVLNRRNYTQSEKDEVMKLFDSGCSDGYIAEKMGYSRMGVKCLVRRIRISRGDHLDGSKTHIRKDIK